MKKTILTPVVFILLLAIPALNTFAQSKDKLKTKLEKLGTELAEAMVAGDYEKSLSFYAEDAISLPSYEPMLMGVEEIRKSAEGMTASGVKVTSFETHIKEIQTCGDMIIEIGLYKISMSVPGSPESMSDHGKYMTIWEKQSDKTLKIKIETWNTDVNPWM